LPSVVEVNFKIQKFGGNRENPLGVESRMRSQKNTTSSNFSAKAVAPVAELSIACDFMREK